jgi:TIR domain
MSDVLIPQWQMTIQEEWRRGFIVMVKATKNNLNANYKVFVSHSGDDEWVAEQIAKRIEDCGAAAFLDRRDIVAGDDFKERIREEIPKCKELLALFTPWSRKRSWVRHEIGMADALKKRIVCVFYKVSITDFDPQDDGAGPLDGLHIIDLNNVRTYFEDLKKRVTLGKGSR